MFLGKNKLKYASLLAMMSCASPDMPMRHVASIDRNMDFFRSDSVDVNQRFAYFMHLDGWRPDVFKAMLEAGQLPHFKMLLQRGKMSLNGTTVDKSETMKVVQSYMSSRRNTEVVGWWQFNREDFSFRNFWITPEEVLNFAIGPTFPKYPTISDYIVNKGKERVVLGFHLQRRSVPFTDYTRNYIEGGMSTYTHDYYNQEHATLGSVVRKLNEIAKNNEKLPILTTTLVAAPDEMSHMYGVTKTVRSSEKYGNDDHKLSIIEDGKYGRYCIKRQISEEDRKGDKYDPIFRILENDKNNKQIYEQIYHEGLSKKDIKKNKAVKYFTKVKLGKGKGILSKLDFFGVFGSDNSGRDEICFNVPFVKGYFTTADGGKVAEVVEPKYALAMIQTDMELGRLINNMRNIRFNGNTRDDYAYNTDWGNGLLKYKENARLENSLFEKTLFVFSSDHGMVNTKNMMTSLKKCKEINSKAFDSCVGVMGSNGSFLEYLNDSLGLTTKKDFTKRTANNEMIGVDDTFQPLEIAYPYKVNEWQSPYVMKDIEYSKSFSNKLYDKLHGKLKNDLADQYKWLTFLRNVLVYPQLDKQIGPYKDKITDLITKLHLRGSKTYLKESEKYQRKFFNKHVRLVYGGGARNNAELFIPTKSSSGKYTWSARPSYDEILNYKPAGKDTIIDALLKNPGVGLIFIRKENMILNSNTLLPNVMNIFVMDNKQNKGLISVWRDKETKELLYKYKVDKDSPKDPLRMGDIATTPTGITKTYNEWNDIASKNNHYYKNVVSGMGSYLYSKNAGIGDIVVMHSQNWNFGENAAGHGGIHHGEKNIFMMVSGAGAGAGEELMSTPRFKSIKKEGKTIVVNADSSTQKHYPTIVDIPTSILSWLGHGNNALTNYSREKQFITDWRNWNRKQRTNIISNLDNVDGVNEFIKSYGFSLKLSDFKEEVKEIFKFLPTDVPKILPDYNESHEDGNVFDFNNN